MADAAERVQALEGGFRRGIGGRRGRSRRGWGRRDEKALGGCGALEFKVVIAVFAVAEADAVPVVALFFAVGARAPSSRWM